MKSIRTLAVAILASTATSQADLLVYEPFDYAPVNDKTFGRLDGRNGGLGFSAAWKDCIGSGSEGLHNNGQTLWEIGKGIGDGMVKMLGDK